MNSHVKIYSEIICTEIQDFRKFLFNFWAKCKPLSHCCHWQSGIRRTRTAAAARPGPGYESGSDLRVEPASEAAQPGPLGRERLIRTPDSRAARAS